MEHRDYFRIFGIFEIFGRVAKVGPVALPVQTQHKLKLCKGPLLTCCRYLDPLHRLDPLRRLDLWADSAVEPFNEHISDVLSADVFFSKGPAVYILGGFARNKNPE